MKIGKYKISTIETGTFGLDGGAMFGIIPKPLWNKSTPADAKNRIKLGARCLLLESESKKILIDTGMGNNWDEKSKTIYDIQQPENALEKALKEKNVNPEEITNVILTHLHFDHVGGAVKKENDKIVPIFPNAKYHVQKEQYNWAMEPSDKDKGSFIKSTFVPLYEEGLLKFVNGEKQFDDEITLIPTGGHTFAHQMVKISDSSNTLLFCGDLIPTAAHVPLPYIMGYDINPLISIEEKKMYLNFAETENWKIIFEHDPVNVCGTIQKTEKGYVVKEKFKELNG
jgi:glyoxylase-like metal-dependent hydrolase (beta-lactamase superfamily II)